MKKISTVVLQAVTMIIGLGVFAFMLLEPHYEGRNMGATLYQVYFNDPFLAYAYIASIPFFVAIYQTFMLLGCIGRGEVFSAHSIKALRMIQYCAKTMVGFAVAAEAYLFIIRPGDDIAGGVFMGLFIIFISGLSAIIAAIFEQILQEARVR